MKKTTTGDKMKIGNIVRTHNPDNLQQSRDGMLAKVIDTNNEDAVFIKFNDGHEEWRLFKDVKLIEQDFIVERS
tara:strand:- start:15 stop:236 length:222 start_codon:yes stop_codon:yes gene_type:complete